jgi:Vps23 core domain
MHKLRPAAEQRTLTGARSSAAADAEVTLHGAGDTAIDPDKAIVAADPLCQQALEAQARDMAVEDTLYALERNFQSGGLPADVYLKQVRRRPAQAAGAAQCTCFHHIRASACRGASHRVAC